MDAYFKVFNKAARHGWRSVGFCHIGNMAYAELVRKGRNGAYYTLCIQPTTGRVFSPYRPRN